MIRVGAKLENSFGCLSIPVGKTRFNPFADAPRRAAAPSSSRWCSLLNQRGIQMAADAPGIQIGAINPRKAALELQPNVSRPAITRPSPASCYPRSRNIEANSFFRLPEKRSTTRDLASFEKRHARFNLILSQEMLPILLFITFLFFLHDFATRFFFQSRPVEGILFNKGRKTEYRVQ